MHLKNTPRWAVACLAAVLSILAGGASAILGTCGPFADVAADAFCPFVLEIFYLGITTGTSATTYDPTATVSRLQMAAFLSRTVDAALKRGSRRAALDQFWVSPALGSVTVGSSPVGVKSDGTDVWVADGIDGTVRRVRGSDMKLLDTWTGAVAARGVLCGAGKVVVTGATIPGQLYYIDPLQPAGAVTVVATNLGNNPRGIAYDGTRIWTANGSSVSIVNPGDVFPWTVTTVTTGFAGMFGPTFDGANIWVTNNPAGKLMKLDSAGAILQTVTVGSSPGMPLFDGSNIWVPNTLDNTISVVRPSSGAVLATLTGNGLSQPFAAAFDGQRVLVTSFDTNNVSLWKAADLTPIGFFDVGSPSNRTASDGLNFWINLQGQLARF